MPDPMSDSEIQSLLDKASPRPWISSTPFGNIPMQVYRQHAPIALMASWEGEKNPHDCNLIAAAPSLIAHLLKRAQKSEAENTEWEEREAKCCPEDVPFQDYIRNLEKRAQDAEAKLKTAETALYRIDEHLNPDLDGNYREDDPKGAMDTAFNVARKAIDDLARAALEKK